MPYKLQSQKDITIGSPFDGAVSGISVTISSTVMRGSTMMMGSYRHIAWSQFYAPLWVENRTLYGPTDNAEKLSLLNFPRLPTTLPMLDKELIMFPTQNRVHFDWGTDMSFSPVTISSTVMRASTAMDAAFNQYRVVAYSPPVTANYFRLGRANYQLELQIFGMINRLLFMDY